MNCWEILGIEPTQDRDRIREAYEGQLKFASEQEAKDLEQAFREATGEMPTAGKTPVAEQKPAEVAAPDQSASKNPDEMLNANDTQIVREVVIQVKALLNDDNRLKDPGIWKAILCEPPADQRPLRREIGRQLEPQVRPMAENGSFPQPVARFLGEWFDWLSVSEASKEPDPAHYPENAGNARHAEQQPEETEDQPPQMVNFWPAVIGWVVGLVLLAAIFGGMSGG